MLDGFQVFRGVELTLLQAVANRVELVVTFDPKSGERAHHDYERLLKSLPGAHVVELKERTAVQAIKVVAGTASDREDQLRAIARQIKQRLTDDPSLRPSDCAVAFRQVSPYLGLARQVFAEYDLPLDPAAGERLNTRPLGVWLRRLLHLAQDGWRLRDLAAVLSSGFIDLGRWRLTPDDVARFTRHGRKNNLWAGQDTLARIADGLRADADQSSHGPTREMGNRIADGMTSAIQDLSGLLEQPPGAAGEHARRLDAALFGDIPLVQPASRKLPGVDVEVDALRAYLRDIAATDAALGGGPGYFDSFVAQLERKLDASAVILREAGGVLLAPMHTLHGLRFDHVTLGGLSSGGVPGAAHRDGASRQ